MIAGSKFLPLTGVIALVVGLVVSPIVMADWQADPDNKNQVKAQAAISRIKEKIPRSASYFDQAYGYAILPSVTRAAIGFGGAYGNGLVIKVDNVSGTT